MWTSANFSGRKWKIKQRKITIISERERRTVWFRSRLLNILLTKIRFRFWILTSKERSLNRLEKFLGRRHIREGVTKGILFMFGWKIWNRSDCCFWRYLIRKTRWFWDRKLWFTRFWSLGFWKKCRGRRWRLQVLVAAWGDRGLIDSGSAIRNQGIVGRNGGNTLLFWVFCELGWFIWTGLVISGGWDWELTMEFVQLEKHLGKWLKLLDLWKFEIFPTSGFG